MSRQRKSLDPAKLNEHFGIHFQKLMDDAGLTVADLRKRLAGKGQKISEQGIRNWMRGDAFPTPFFMVPLAEIFNQPDYRHILPERIQKRRQK